MKVMFRFCLVVFFAMIYAQVGRSADYISVPFDFAEPKVSLNPEGDLTITMDGLMNSMEAGLPRVPFQTYKIALPRGTHFSGVTLTEKVSQSIIGKLERTGSQLPMCHRDNVFREAVITNTPDYGGPVYPTHRIATSLQYLHGVPVVIINIFSVVENRDEGRVYFLKNGEMAVNFIRENIKENDVTLLPHQTDELSRLVSNPDVIKTYPKTKKLYAEAYDYLIVTVDTFIKYQGEWSLDALQNGLKARGLRTKVTNVKDIAANTGGRDLAEKIRFFIRDEYKKSGIRYVLLVGDGDESGSGAMIPARKLWSKIRAYNGQWMWIEENIPADIYYAALDGTFNGNNNSKWGEPNDGDARGDVDFLAEVSVGRLPIKTVDELKNTVRKTLWVYTNTVPKKVFLMGEELFADLGLTGSAYMNQLVGQCTDHNYTTTGYRADWKIEKLYDSSDTVWSGEDAQAKINSGKFTMINHLGHSNINFNMRLDNIDVKYFENETPFFYYTQGCLPGDFTSNECFIELLVRFDNGAVAAIANSRYGLAPEDPAPNTTKTPGASQMLHRRFINAVFSENVTNLGRAHQVSKEEFVGLVNAQEMRWVMWVANFFGDPSIEFRY